MAARVARSTGVTSMFDPLVIYGCPELLGEELEEVLFGFQWLMRVFLEGKAEAMSDAIDMGINSDALHDTEAHVEDDIGSFSTYSREHTELFHSMRNLTAKFTHDKLCSLYAVECLSFVKAD